MHSPNKVLGKNGHFSVEIYCGKFYFKRSIFTNSIKLTGTRVKPERSLSYESSRLKNIF